MSFFFQNQRKHLTFSTRCSPIGDQVETNHPARQVGDLSMILDLHLNMEAHVK